MEWTKDVAAGAWLRGRVDDPWRHTMHDVVPRGFAAYARVFHPGRRERPVGRPWPAEGDAAGWEAFLATRPEVDTERVTWAEVASAFGTVMHPYAQWQRLVRGDEPHAGGASPRDRAGWRYDAPEQGQLEPDVLALLAGVLAAHTATPDRGFVALWEGWGGLVGGMGTAPSRTFFGWGFTEGGPDADGHAADDDTELRHAAFLSHSTRDVFNNPFQQVTWQPGILSDEISRGPRLELPGRSYVLFRAGVQEFANPLWELDAPWRDRVAEQHGWDPSAHSPAYVWPGDHAWVVTCEVDFDSTVVAGSIEVVEAVLAEPGIEALRIAPGTDLGADGDAVNG